MARFISFSTIEKLSILKILIDINNVYNSGLLSNTANEVIYKVCTMFKLPNGINDAYNIPVSDAQNILIKNIKVDEVKKKFFNAILGAMLRTSNYGVFNEKSKWHKCRYLSLYSDDAKALKKEMRKEWSYVFNLLEGYTSWYESELTKFAVDLFIADSNLFNSDWVILDNQNNNPKTPSATENPQTNIEFPKDNIEEMRRVFKEEIRKEITEEIRKELELKIRKEIKEEFRDEIKNFTQGTLYKDL